MALTFVVASPASAQSGADLFVEEFDCAGSAYEYMSKVQGELDGVSYKDQISVELHVDENNQLTLSNRRKTTLHKEKTTQTVKFEVEAGFYTFVPGAFDDVLLSEACPAIQWNTSLTCPAPDLPSDLSSYELCSVGGGMCLCDGYGGQDP